MINDDKSDSRDGDNGLNGFTFQCKKRESLLASGEPLGLRTKAIDFGRSKNYQNGKAKLNNWAIRRAISIGGPKNHEGEVIMGCLSTKLDHLSGPVGIQKGKRNNDLSDLNIKGNGHGHDTFLGSEIGGTSRDLLEKEGGLTIRGGGRWK